MVDNFHLLRDLMNKAATLKIRGTEDEVSTSAQALTDAFQAALEAWNEDRAELRKLRARG